MSASPVGDGTLLGRADPPTPEELDQRCKGVVRRMREETTMTLNWIAKELRMGVAGSLANLLRKKK